jgi:stalled ribosome alternative rescue factor ArfA
LTIHFYEFYSAYSWQGNDHHDRHKVLIGRFRFRQDAERAAKGKGFYGVGDGEVERTFVHTKIFDSYDEFLNGDGRGKLPHRL